MESKCIIAFETYLTAEQNRSRLTVAAYMRDLQSFLDWLGAKSDFSPADVTQADIRAWLSAEASRGLKPVSLRRKTESLRAFFRWAMIENLSSTNPAGDVNLAKIAKKLPDIIREEDMEMLLGKSDSEFSDDFEEARTHLVLNMLYSLGLRQAELLALDDNHINFIKLEAKITGKRNKQRIVPLPEALASEIKHYQQIRDERYPGTHSNRPLICGAKGRISTKTLYNIVRNGLEGVSTGRKSPHTLRHTFATAMLNDGSDLDAVKEMLGHRSLSTTQIYTHLSIRQLRENYNAHPRARKKDEKES